MVRACRLLVTAWQARSFHFITFHVSSLVDCELGPRVVTLANILVRPTESREMTARIDTPHSNFTAALEAIRNLLLQELNDFLSSGWTPALSAHTEIRLRPITLKTGPFYRYFRPLRTALCSLLADSYRRYFKLALAHPRQSGNDPHEWAWGQLQRVVGAALEWICDWYILACDGENQYVRRPATIAASSETSSLSIPLTVPPCPPPQSWRAPAWLFQVSIADVGIGRLKTKNVPADNSEERLGLAHTRLLLKGARRVFSCELAAAVDRVRNEEIAAAGAIPVEAANMQARGPNKRKGWEQRSKLYAAIQKVLSDNRELHGMAFCGALDKRHAPPLFDWVKTGDWREGLTWKEAWSNSRLRRKIRRVRQEAMKRH